MSTEKTYKRYTNTLPVVISIALVLYVLGIFGLFFWKAWLVSKEVQENIKFEVFFDDAAGDMAMKGIQDDLKAKPFVREVHFISKDEAAQLYVQQFGEDFTQVLQFNPLKASLEVFIVNDKTDPEELKTLIATLEKDDAVYEVNYAKPVVENIGSQLRTLSLIFIVLISLLLIISLALINNSIRLSFYSQRFLIKSMQLVGATRRFIMSPYIGSALMQGFLGSLIAITLISATIFSLQKSFPVTSSVFEPYHLGVVYGGIIVAGIIISSVSTLIIMQKYLRRSAYALY